MKGPLLCALVLLAAILATCPWGPVPFGDDWDYEETARSVAQTGHMRYHGWGEPTLGVQAFWGALFIKLFGPSFEAIRFSTTPVALACAVLIYVLARQLGCSEKLCWFGTLVVMTSPIVLSLEASFMTELPSLFFELVCVMALIHALRARDPSVALAWLIGFTASCLLGGSIRQSNWLTATSLPLLALYWWRRRAPGWLSALTLSLPVLLFIVARWFQHWYEQHPGSVHHGLLNPTGRSPIYEVAKLSFLFLSTVAIFILPCTLLFVRWTWRSKLYVLVSLMLCGLAYVWLGRIEHNWLPLPTGALTSTEGIASTTVLGNQPWLGGYWLWLGMAVLAIVAAATAIWAIRSVRVPDSAEGADLGRRRLVEWLLVAIPFGLVYTAAVEVRAREFTLQDRYPLPLLPIVVLTLLMLYQQGFGRLTGPVRIPAYCWGCLAAFAYFSIAGTHDHYAALRAVQAQAQQLISGGAPRTSIVGGFEFDAPTQLMAAGQLDNQPKRLHNFSYWFSPYIPAIEGRWLITEAHYPGMAPSQFATRQFTLWLPPFRRQMLIEQIPDQQRRKR